MTHGEIIELNPGSEETLPLEKSMYANLGLRDLIEGNPRTAKFLRAQPLLPNDLRTVTETSELILAGKKEIPVEEGGAWARKLALASATFNWGLTIIRGGTLADRPDDFTPDMITWSLKDLGTLNKSSSQLQSAAVMCGNTEPMPEDAAYHLRLAYEARDLHDRWPRDEPWEVMRDRTHRRQSIAHLGWLVTGQMMFAPIQPEDYAFARVFGVMTPEEARASGWDSLEGHESPRFESVDESIDQALSGQIVTVNDHRPIQSLRRRYGLGIRFAHIEAVSKSWLLPQFNAHLAHLRIHAEELKAANAVI